MPLLFPQVFLTVDKDILSDLRREVRPFRIGIVHHALRKYVILECSDGSWRPLSGGPALTLAPPYLERCDESLGSLRYLVVTCFDERSHIADAGRCDRETTEHSVDRFGRQWPVSPLLWM